MKSSDTRVFECNNEAFLISVKTWELKIIFLCLLDVT